MMKPRSTLDLVRGKSGERLKFFLTLILEIPFLICFMLLGRSKGFMLIVMGKLNV